MLSPSHTSLMADLDDKISSALLPNVWQLPDDSEQQKRDLGDVLLRATSEIKSLQEENHALKQQIVLLEISHVSELNSRDEILAKVLWRRRARTRAYVDTLYQLTVREMQLKESEEQWRSRYDALELNLRRQMTDSQESWRKRLDEMEMELILERQWNERTSHTEEDTQLFICETDQLQGRQPDTPCETEHSEKTEQPQEEPMMEATEGAVVESSQREVERREESDMNDLKKKKKKKNKGKRWQAKKKNRSSLNE